MTTSRPVAAMAVLAGSALLVALSGAQDSSQAAQKNKPIRGFYTAPQDLTMLAPGEFGSVRSRCKLGDQVVSGSIVTRGTPEFWMISSGIVIDGSSGQESWVLQGTNNSASRNADIRVSAICASTK